MLTPCTALIALSVIFDRVLCIITTLGEIAPQGPPIARNQHSEKAIVS